MSVEFLRNLADPELVKLVDEQNIEHRGKKIAFSKYHTLSLIFKGEGTKALRQRDLSNVDIELNRASISFGVAMMAMEKVLKDGVFDQNEMMSYYTEAIRGTSSNHVVRVQLSEKEPQQIPEDQLKRIIEWTKRDKTHAILFTDGWSDLPDGIRELIVSSATFVHIRTKVLPLYVTLAKLLPEPKPFVPTPPKPEPEPEPMPEILPQHWLKLEAELNQGKYR